MLYIYIYIYKGAYFSAAFNLPAGKMFNVLECVIKTSCAKF